MRQKKYNLEENLKLLQEQKHQLFLCLKTTLLAKEHVRQERAPTITHEISVQHHETGEKHFQNQSVTINIFNFVN